ncbi:MAG: translation elongation factor 4 [Candidatus Buchananbacteria bacterium]
MIEKNIRNFCIIAHIDHGKSTLADRFLELTKTVAKRDMKDQLLDQMDIERERGITIKLQPVRMNYHFNNQDYELNLIDTPGHVDFTYEVSRSLAAVEGAILLVDATQGVQAQTLANLYLALEQDLTIIPVINKIDLPASQVEKCRGELKNLLGCADEEIILASGKSGQGVEEILQAVVRLVPPPVLKPEAPLRALIFDSVFDEYKGVIAFVRVVDGQIKAGDQVAMFSSRKESEVLEVGMFKPKLSPVASLQSGEIGYVVTGLKEVRECKVGDTIIAALGVAQNQVIPLPGYKEVKPMVFAGIFCRDGSDFPKLRDSIEKLKSNDASLTFEPENSQALGFGFRCGFLGLLHLEIFQERLLREYGLDLVVTTPSVAYKIYLKNRPEPEIIYNPLHWPDPGVINSIEEPVMKLDLVTPKDYLGGVMQLAQEKRGVYLNTEYLAEDLVLVHYQIPLTAILVDFYDKLKSVSSGYASLNYEFFGYQKAEVIKLDILVAEDKVEALSSIVYEDEAFRVGRKICETLKETLPKQQFLVKIQAAIGGKIVASEHLSALRKDVTAKLYGGDWTRRAKLLEKQKKGKKKMMQQGRVEIPPESFLAVLKR